jgi:hypothetical protein
MNLKAGLPVLIHHSAFIIHHLTRLSRTIIFEVRLFLRVL